MTQRQRPIPSGRITIQSEDIIDKLPDVNIPIELQITNKLAGPDILESPTSQFANFIPEKPAVGLKGHIVAITDADLTQQCTNNKSASDHGDEMENVSIAEPSFTDLFFITRNSHYAFQDFGEMSPTGARTDVAPSACSRFGKLRVQMEPFDYCHQTTKTLYYWS
ncbi:hypothetical protein JCM33374_g427 [Metschnikowia sp. JCM 33374]|nr:hypothetical protein JCM33374_g427 [Metschnikowia sp. JCM 33374]